MIERGERVPGDGPAQERKSLKDFADWYRWSTNTVITGEQIEKFLYDQWMLGEEE